MHQKNIPKKTKNFIKTKKKTVSAYSWSAHFVRVSCVFINRFAPGGALLAKVEVPVECVTSCCFGGENWDELYITTSSRDLDEAGRAEQPLAGGVFRCKPDVTGPATNLFLG